jgi:hypothetical protein
MQHQRGQAYTLQGVIGAVIVISSVILGLQAVDIVAFTGGEDREMNEVRVQANDVLDIAAEADALRAATTCVAGNGNPDPTVVSPAKATTAFGEIINDTVAGANNYRVLVDYPADGEVRTVGLDTDRARPLEATATATRQIALFDSDPVREPGRDCKPRLGADGEPVTLAEEERQDDDFYLEDIDEDSELFSVVRVRVVIW